MAEPKRPTGIFEVENEINKDMLRTMRTKYVSKEYSIECYNKLKKNLPFLLKQFIYMNEQEMIEALHASAYYLEINAEQVWGNKNYIDTRALSNFINSNLAMVYDEEEKELVKNGQGLGFLNSFIKESLMQVTVANKGSKTVRDRLEDNAYCFKVCCKTLAFGADLTLVRLGSSTRFVDTQVLSNFRPLASAWIIEQYGVLPNLHKDEIWIRCPSEGWLARMLSSYYIAYHYQDKQIHYITTDPNLRVVEFFGKISEYLRNCNPLYDASNWHPEIYAQGSEGPESRFSVTKGYKFDLAWTSPPYGSGQEEYSETYKVTLIDLDLIEGKKYKVLVK